MVAPRFTSLDKREAELFQGREPQIEALRARIKTPLRPDEREILLYSGVGGIGKSALARRLVRELRAAYEEPAGFLVRAKPAWAAIDVAEIWARDSLQALLQIRLQLGVTWREARFPIFDYAFARIHAERAPSSDVLKHYGLLTPDGSLVQRFAGALPMGLKDSDTLQEAAAALNELLEDIPLLNTGYKVLNRVFHGGQAVLDRTNLPLLAEIAGIGADHLERRLPEILGTDIRNAIADNDQRRPLFVVVDTLEAFHSERPQKSGIGAHDNDLALRELLWHSPGVTFLLLGRDPVEWADYEDSPLRDWSQLIRHQALNALGETEVEEVLRAFPVPETEIRARMTQGAEGLPFYLGLQLDIYSELKTVGRQPVPEDFAKGPKGVVARFISHIGPRRSEALTVLALARRFDEDLFEHLRESGDIGREVALSDILRLSLVEGDTGTGYRLHQHFRDIVRDDLARRDGTRQRRLDERLFAFWDARCQPNSVRDLSLAHEIALQEAFYHRSQDTRQALVEWLTSRWWVFFQATRLLLLGRLWEQALLTSERDSEEPEAIIAIALGNLGILLERQDDLAGAAAAQRRALAMMERVYGPDHAEVAITLGNLGILLARQDDLAGAAAVQRRALAIMERVCGPDHADVARTLGNLGNVLARQDDLVGAAEAQRRALAIKKRVYGPDHAEVARTLGNLGNVLERQDDLSGAAEAQRRALAIKERVYGPDHAEVAITLGNLGNVLEHQDDLSGAAAAQRRALAINERVYGSEHAEVAATLDNLGTVLERQDDLSGAAAAQRRALAIKERVYGPDHAEVAVTLGNLGIVLRCQDDLAGAAAAERRALAIFETVHCSEHSLVEQASRNLSRTLDALGDKEEAEALRVRADAIAAARDAS
ncbi:MAG: hypothetical protein Kilf2KO_33190 [Rhodospirillales bacterium]